MLGEAALLWRLRLAEATVLVAVRRIYSRVHISSDTAFLKILKKPSIVQE